MPNGCNWSKMFNWSITEQPQLQHFTDFLRRSMLPEVQPTVQPGRPIIDLPCVTKLNTSGMEFKGIEDTHLPQISLRRRKLGKWLPWFEINELQIPRILICDQTEKIFRNLMALEIFHYPNNTYICHYTDLMDCLIDTDKDVDLLVEKGIIVNWVGDIKAIVRMFNRLNLQILIENSSYYEVVKEMKAHYRHPWNHLKATLKDVYFSNLWTSTATIGASFLLILTAIQTIYTMKQ
ncbi:hypothetical protein LWI29_009396 [Acer saccharum]|uniref:DUF247 domain protein n=1 Tax=Acer saccharum TaxID=4024 RepID=A0AA39S246_ACESA|nr:hypothetical protein LWI29_009396 [Acer saccharum]